MATNRVHPVRNKLYTLKEVLTVLYLRDSPGLSFEHEGKRGCIQNSHLTDEELLSVPGIGETQWRYVRETLEWIPLFTYVPTEEHPVITEYVDVEPYVDTWSLCEDDHWWATPKGFPRLQSE